MSKKFTQFLQVQGIENQHTMAYHQQANGLVKHIIQTLKTMMRKQLANNDQPLTDCGKVLGECRFAYNTVQESMGRPLFLKAGIPPQTEKMGGSWGSQYWPLKWLHQTFPDLTLLRLRNDHCTA